MGVVFASFLARRRRAALRCPAPRKPTKVGHASGRVSPTAFIDATSLLRDKAAMVWLSEPARLILALRRCYNARPPEARRQRQGIRMNKAELIDAVSGQSGLAKTEATRAVDAVFETITTALRGGDSVALLGFGTFVVKARAARSGRNPRTGEAIAIAASKVPDFKAGKALKDAVN
jgi:DNA-binding protein HU-beta